MTMVEWSTTMARLGSFNEHPGMALNCDGGASALIGVADKDGKMLVEARGIRTDSSNPRAANYVALQKNRN